MNSHFRVTQETEENCLQIIPDSDRYHEPLTLPPSLIAKIT